MSKVLEVMQQLIGMELIEETNKRLGKIKGKGIAGVRQPSGMACYFVVDNKKLDYYPIPDTGRMVSVSLNKGEDKDLRPFFVRYFNEENRREALKENRLKAFAVCYESGQEVKIAKHIALYLFDGVEADSLPSL